MDIKREIGLCCYWRFFTIFGISLAKKSGRFKPEGFDLLQTYNSVSIWGFLSTTIGSIKKVNK